jgi:phosphoglucosamine mutase
VLVNDRRVVGFGGVAAHRVQRPAVGDDQHRVVASEVVERREHALAQIEQALAAFGCGRKRRLARLPDRKFGVFLEHRLVGQSLIDTGITLAPAFLDGRCGFDAGFVDAVGRLAGPAEVRGHSSIEVVACGEVFANACGLFAPAFGQRRGCPTLNASLCVPIGLAVTNQHDGHGGVWGTRPNERSYRFVTVRVSQRFVRLGRRTAMFGTSGIRGPIGEEVTAALALDVGRALGIDCERVVVGRDPRESGFFLLDALTAGLRESGTDVLDAGLAATPTVARAVGWHEADAGVSVTASHNPAPDNGLKLWQPSGQAFDEGQREAIARRVREGETSLVPWDELGERVEIDAGERHTAALRDIDIEDPPSVVVDLGNGAGGVTVDALQALGCEVETLNAQPDGSFPGRPSEPTGENCESLRALVAASDAEVGLAHDGDADRLRAVTDEGDFIAGDVLLALFAREAVADSDIENPRVAAPVDTSLAVDDALAPQASVTHTKVGDVFVAERATDSDVVFGGEPSGAWIWPGETLCPDGPLAACRLVELASERPLSERVAEVDTYPIRREGIEVGDKHGVMERVEERVTEEYDDVRTLDGVRVDFDDGWVLVRASGTQPLVRITAEARDGERCGELFDTASAIVETAREE